MNNGDSYNYSPISVLPSRMVAYPRGSRIECREFTFDEVMYFTEHSKDEIAIMTKFQKNQIILTEGFDFWDLTLGDWLFLLLTTVSSSHINATYNYSANCPECAGRIDRVEIKLPTGGVRGMNVEGKMVSKLIPSEIEFKSLDDEVILPVEVVLSNNAVAEIDFIRLRHYKETKEKGTPELQLITGLPVGRFGITDIQLLSYVRDEVLYHGPTEELLLKCQLCGKIAKVPMKWEALEFLPFREDRATLRHRVRFGSRRISTNVSDTQTSIQTDGSPVPKFSKVT